MYIYGSQAGASQMPPVKAIDHEYDAREAYLAQVTSICRGADPPEAHIDIRQGLLEDFSVSRCLDLVRIVVSRPVEVYVYNIWGCSLG